jgi:hypothetical protein
MVFREFAVATGVILSFVFLTAVQSSAQVPVAHCISAHCAIVANSPSPPVVLLAAKGLGPQSVTHPGPAGIYCVQPSVIEAHPYTPVVSVAGWLSAPITGAGPGADLAEINHGATGCPAVPVGQAPFLEVDTFAITLGAAGTIVTPQDDVGFDIEF